MQEVHGFFRVGTGAVVLGVMAAWWMAAVPSAGWAAGWADASARGGSPPVAADSVFAATYLGGGAEDGYREVAVLLEPAGTVLVAGSTRSVDFPSWAGAYDDTHNGGCDVFLARFDGRLSTLLAVTFFGGSGDDGGWPGVSLAEDGQGRIYVAGPTTSSDLPVTAGALDPTPNGGSDLFVARFSHGLDSLLACTYLGGSANEGETQVVLGAADDLYLAGSTASSNFPTTPGAFDRTRAGGTDAFASRVSRDLTTLLASTFLGGTYDEYAPGLLWDPRGYLYLTGVTNTYGFPTTPGAYDRQVNSSGSDVDVFISRFSGDLTTLSASTFIGGTKTDFAYRLALGTTGDIFVTGHVQSTDYPTTPSAYDRTYNSPPGDYDDVFVSRLSADLSELQASTYLGGGGWDWGLTLASDGDGHLIVGGETQSSDFPTTPGAFEEAMPGAPPDQNGFLSKLDEDLTTLEASTYVGGSGNDLVSRVVTDAQGNILASGGSGSLDFPMAPDSYDTSFAGGANRWGGDVVLLRLDALLTAGAFASGIDPRAGERSGCRLDIAPNPVGTAASIGYILPSAGRVALAVFDAGGRRVVTLAEGMMGPGTYGRLWNGRDDAGRELGSGVYFVRLTAGRSAETARIVVVR